MKIHRHDNHLWQLRQLTIWLLFLFLGVGEAMADGTGTSSNPFHGRMGSKDLEAGTYYLNGVTSGSIRMKGDIKLIVSGTNSLSGGGSSYPQPAIGPYDKKRYNLTLEGKDGGVLNLAGDKTQPTSTGPTWYVGGIGPYAYLQNNDYTQLIVFPGPTVSITGSIYVYATGYGKSVPGIGGVTSGVSNFAAGGKSDIYIDNGACLSLENDLSELVESEKPYVIPSITTSTYALVKVNGTPIRINEGSAYYRNVKYDNMYPSSDISSGFTSFSMSGLNSTKIYAGMEGTSNQFPFYFANNPTTTSYALINNIPCPMGATNVHLGVIRSGNKYYKEVGYNTYTSDVYLNISNYALSGTITAGANIKFYGNGHSLSTTSSGITLNASSYSIQLSSINLNSGSRLNLKGKVYRYSGTLSGMVYDQNNNVVYACETTNLLNISGQKIVSILRGNTQSYNYYLDGSTLYTWLPAGQQEMTIKTDYNTYTGTRNTSTTHGQTFTVAVTGFDITKSALTLQTGSSTNAITFAGTNASTPEDIPLTLYSTGTASNKAIEIKGGYAANITLSDLTSTTSGVPLKVTGTNTTANLTISGTNSFTSSTDDAFYVDEGSKIVLKGNGTLNLSGSANDLNVHAKGKLDLDGTVTVNALNSKFKPNLAISGTPKVYLGGKQHFLASILYAETKVGTISNTHLKTLEGDPLSTNMYALSSTDDGTTYNFWMPEKMDNLYFTGDYPKAGTFFTIPEATYSAHNTVLTAIRLGASIKETTVIYASLAEAFAAALDGQHVQLEADINLPNNNTSLLSKLDIGEGVTLDLNGYNLKAATGSVLASGKGTLTIENNGAAGALLGTHAFTGCVYTGLSGTALNNGAALNVNGLSAYRVWVKGLPAGIGNTIVYRVGQSPTEYKAQIGNNGNACLWLPSGEQEVILCAILDTENEPMAGITGAVKGNHDENTLTAIPHLDIAYGDIHIKPTSTGSTVKYGKKPYELNVEVGNSAAKRLAIYGTASPDNGNKNNQLLVESGGTGTAYLTLREVNIQPKDKAAIQVSAPADIELEGDNYLRGSTDGTMPAIRIADAQALTLSGENVSGQGRLYAYGAAVGTNFTPAIQSGTNAKVTFAGGTFVARHGNGDMRGAISGDAVIRSGSVDALFTNRPTNKDGKNVYRVDITTGLNPDQPFQITYDGCDPASFYAMPDAAGKIYHWLEARTIDKEKAKATLTHPVSYEKTEIEIAEIQENDNNVAPIVIRMVCRNDGKESAYGNLQDAFDAMEGGRAGAPNRYDLKLLTRVANLRTRQSVPTHAEAYLDLSSFEIAAQNGSDAAFDASSEGAYLEVSGKGNIKNTVKIAGDMFITGVVPLTDAVIELDGKAVFRTLVKGLPVAAGNAYTYSYGERQSVPFFLHNGEACLWLPDYGRSEELRFLVSGNGGSATEYTAGNITTVTQRTEAIPANPVGVVARVTYTKGDAETNNAYNTLAEAFAAAGTASAAPGVSNVTVHLLTGINLTSKLSVKGSFTLNLDGKSVTSAAAGALQVEDGHTLVIGDQTTGTKGTLQINDIRLMGKARLFVPGSIRLSGNVHKDADDTDFYWRVLLNMSSDYVTAKKVTYEGEDYSVINNEACLWLKANNDPAAEYTFTVEGKTVTANNQVSANHDNDMTLGGNNNPARIGTKEFDDLEKALDAAKAGETVELLKTVTLTSDYTLTSKSISLQLGKYELNGASLFTIGTNSTLTVESRSGTGKLLVPLKLDGGNLYAGQDIDGENIGDVTGAGSTTSLYRLLVTNIPSNIPGGNIYGFTYTDLNASGNPTGKPQTGQFTVRNSVACLWLEEATARQLIFTVSSASFKTNNVTVNDNHFNMETYGVNDVAQIRNGKKYRTLADAFKDAAGRTVALLKNAALTADITVSGSVVLEMGEYSITSQEIGNEKAAFIVSSGANLRVTGSGTVNSKFSISAVPDHTTFSNGNLQVDKTVNMTGEVRLNGELCRRVNVEGAPDALPAQRNVTYSYAGQTGQVKTSGTGTLCLWMKNTKNDLDNFYVDVDGGDSFLAQVIIIGSNDNPVTLTKVKAVAETNGKPYDNLEDAVKNSVTGVDILLRKDILNQTKALISPDGVKATLDMQGFSITGSSLSLSSTGQGGQLRLRSGALSGTFMIDGNVFMDGDVTMTTATVAQAGKTVWRTLVTLPEGTASFKYKLGDESDRECVNIHTPAGGKPVACLWLPSSNVARTLTVSTTGNEYALNNVVIASTHGNELDITNGNSPVAQADGKQYASLASALAGATGTITLLRDLTLGTIQPIAADRTIHLNKFRITSTNGGFDTSAEKTLTLRDGQLLGTLALNGDGSVAALGDVKIAGIVLRNHEEIYRVLVKVKDATQCLWVTTSKEEEERTIGTGYEVTIPAGLSNHNTTLTAYEVKTLDAAGSWQATYANTRLKLGTHAVLTLPEGTKATLNRLILRDGARVTGKGQVTATEGIRYIRAIGKGKWESIALPFTATRITMEDNAGKPRSISPAYGNGNAGNFWLRTVSANGALITVNSPEMTANQFYLIAVPDNMGGKELTFVSGANQLLRRDKVLAVKPASGFAAYANGTLDNVVVDQPCYVLGTNGKSFVREMGTTTIVPFRGYLLADAATTAVTPELRMAGIPTATETIVPGEPLRVSTRRGALTVSTGRSVTVRIYTMNGFPVESFKLEYGERTVFLPTGIYIVNRQKVWVD